MSRKGEGRWRGWWGGVELRPILRVRRSQEFGLEARRPFGKGRQSKPSLQGLCTRVWFDVQRMGP